MPDDKPPDQSDEAERALALDRLTDEIGRLAEAFARSQTLVASLRQAFAPIEEGQDDPTTQRIAYVNALIGLSTFCRRWTGNPGLGSHFDRLGVMLIDLERGVGHPVLDRKNNAGRPPDASEVWLCRAQVAAGIQCLILAGMPKPEAIEWAVEKYPTIGQFLRPQARAELHAAIAGWLDIFLKVKRGKATPQVLAWFDAERHMNFDPGVSEQGESRDKFQRLAERYLGASEYGAKSPGFPKDDDPDWWADEFPDGG